MSIYYKNSCVNTCKFEYVYLHSNLLQQVKAQQENNTDNSDNTSFIPSSVIYSIIPLECSFQHVPLWHAVYFLIYQSLM